MNDEIERNLRAALRNLRIIFVLDLLLIIMLGLLVWVKVTQ